MNLLKVLRFPIGILENIFSYLEFVYFEYVIYKYPYKCKGLTIIKYPVTYLKDRKKHVGFVGYDD